MRFRLKEKDCKVLECIAEYRLLTVSEIAAVLDKNRQVIRKRLHELEKGGLLKVASPRYGRGRGRPERAVGLTEQGVDVLKDKGLLSRDVECEKALADGLFGVDHQLLLNWFRIQLIQVEKVLPRMSIRVFAHSSPFLPKDQKGHILIADYSPVPGTGTKGVKFTPDAVLSMSDSVGGKTCLFFLEVDRGTEIMGSPKRAMTDIRQKIINYQWYFQSLAYKRYEEVLKCQLNGFRLLFLTSSPGRLVALCKLTQRIQPSGFVWLTECSRVLRDGVSAKIWARGGDLHASQGSILGSLCCRAPLS